MYDMTNRELYTKLTTAEGMNYPYGHGREFFADMSKVFGTEVAKEMARTYIDLMEEYPETDGEMDFIRQIRMAVREA